MIEEEYNDDDEEIDNDQDFICACILFFLVWAFYLHDIIVTV